MNVYDRIFKGNIVVKSFQTYVVVPKSSRKGKTALPTKIFGIHKESAQQNNCFGAHFL